MALNSISFPLFESHSRPEVFVLPPHKLNLNPDDFMPRRSRGCKTSNAFMIYRTIYTKILTQIGLPSKMTKVSRWASDAWSAESEELKNEYREFAKEVRKIYRERPQARLSRIPILPQPTTSSSRKKLNNKTAIQFQNPTITPFFNANFQEQQNLPTFFEHDHSLIQHDMCQLNHYETCDNMEELSTIPSAYNPLIWQEIYDGEINMNMDNFIDYFINKSIYLL